MTRREDYARLSKGLTVTVRAVLSILCVSGLVIVAPGSAFAADGASSAERITEHGWEMVSKGVFVNTSVGDSSVVTKAGNARTDRNLGIKVDGERATARRIQRNGDLNLIDRTDDGKVVVPGSRVHGRGVLVMVTATTPAARDTTAAASTNRHALVYVDTNATIRNGSLVGASFGEDAWRAIRPSAEVALRVTNATSDNYQIKLLDRDVAPLPPNTSQGAQYFSDAPGTDDVSGVIINAEGLSWYFGARNPLFGSPRATFGSTTHIFDNKESCYFVANGLYAYTQMKIDTGQSAFFAFTMSIGDSAPSGVPACSAD